MKYSPLGTAGTVGLLVACASSDDTSPAPLRLPRHAQSGPTGTATIPTLE